MSTQPLDPAAAWDWRRAERHLLLACLACMGLGFILALASAPAQGRALAPVDLLPLLSYAAGIAALHLGLVMAGSRGDPVLVVTAAFLAGLGLLAQTRMGTFDGAGPMDLDRMVLPAGMLLMLGTAAVFMGGRYRMLAQRPWIWAGLSLAVVLLVLATGQRFRGALFGLGNTTPTEALKVLTVLFLAGFVDRHAKVLAQGHPWFPLPAWDPIWRLLAFWTVLTGLLLLQRDLGMVAILGLALMAVLTAGTRRFGYAIYGLLVAGGLGYALLALFEHGQRRLSAWLDPFQDPTGDGWQILQGLSGIYAGGLWGEGFGAGAPGYTPIADSDFIYTVIGEELGLIGSTLVLIFYLALLQRGLAIAESTRDGFGRLVATGLTTVLAVQTLLNIGGVTKLIPLTGVTLPLVSHGGASLVTTFAALGLLLAISDGPTGTTPKRGPARGPTTPKRPPQPGKRKNTTRRTAQSPAGRNDQ